MTAEIHQFATATPEALASQARRALDQIERKEGDLIDHWIEYGCALLAGRKFYPGDTEYGQWKAEHGLDQFRSGKLPERKVEDHEAMAALWAAEFPEELAAMRLQKTKARTLRGFHDKHQAAVRQRERAAGKKADGQPETKRQSVAERKAQTEKKKQEAPAVLSDNLAAEYAKLRDRQLDIFETILRAGRDGISRDALIEEGHRWATHKHIDTNMAPLFVKALVRAIQPGVFAVCYDPLGPEPDPATVPKSVQAYRARLEREFEWKVQERMQAQWTEARLEFEKIFGKKLAEAEAIRDAYRGIMTEEQHKLFRMALHPDTNLSTEKKAEAFREFNSLKIKLLPPERELTRFSMADLYQRERQVKEARAQKRAAAKAQREGGEAR